MSNHFNIIVIGSGPGGYIAALKAAQIGARVAVVEYHPFFGGTCLNWGCIPSKALLATAELAHKIEHAAEMGVEVSGGATVNWKAVQGRKDKVLRGLRGGIKSLFAARKVTSFHGRGVLDGPGRVVVQKEDGSPAETITGDKVILGLGSLPSMLPGWPSEREIVATSDEALHWKELPKKLLIVGGGVIGCEFACIMQPLGVEVTVVEIMPKLLLGMDQSLADFMAKVFKQRGIKVLLSTKVEDLQIADNSAKARFSTGQTESYDRVLVATGRKPNTVNVGLESTGITMTKRGFVQVNDKMETSVKDVYCIGDANGKCLLAHAASAHGVTAVKNALGENDSFHAPVPSCVYTFPEVAAVGMTQEAAEEKGLPIAIGNFPIGHLGKAMAAGETDGFVKIIRHRETGEMLGAHMAGHNVTEVIASAAALIHQKATVEEAAEMVWAHPTISEAVKEASEDALYMALHLPPRKMMRVPV